MKVLVYSNCQLDPKLGSGKTRVRFSEGLRARGHEVRVIEPDEVILLPTWSYGRRFRIALGAVWHARRALQQEHFDIVEIAGGEFGWLVRWLSGKRKRPLLVHRSDGCELLSGRSFTAAPRATPTDSTRARRSLFSWVHHRLDESAFAHVDGCVLLSSADRDFLRDDGYKTDAQLRVVAPGLDDEFLAYPAPEARALRLVFLGSWIERKGIGTLVAALTGILQAHPQVTVDLLGTGLAPIQVLAGFPAAVHHRITVAGRLERAELAARITRASIFVLPARYEGFGMATTEAMACGCAVVTTRTGFGADLRDGEDALLVPFESPRELQAALERLVLDEALRLRIARGGWARVQQMRWENRVAELEAVYHEWLARHGAESGPIL